LETKTREKELEKAIDDAVKLHGHLGPFLVIGVRMGKAAKEILRSRTGDEFTFQATIKVPQTTPFSCAIDGIQSTTHCTIGNQKLEIEKSEQEICGSFQVQNPKRALTICVKRGVIEELMNRFSKGVTNEELAAQVASMPENELFTIEKSGHLRLRKLEERT
jgi:formylmethanofuran dehydrogenase subunit E